jgi:hypothetical protein
MKNLRVMLCRAMALAVLAGFLPQLNAADVTGKWGWSTPGRQGGEPRKMTLELKAEGEKLTGKLLSPGWQGGEARATEISDGKVVGDEISFAIKREYNGNQMVIKYKGKVSGDTIKGKSMFDRGGQTREMDWEAKREPAKSGARRFV